MHIEIVAVFTQSFNQKPTFLFDWHFKNDLIQFSKKDLKNICICVFLFWQKLCSNISVKT